MRRMNLALGLLFLVGCGSDENNNDSDGPPGDDDVQFDSTPPTPDAAVPTCTPVTGTTVGVEELTGLDNLADVPLLVTAAPGDARLFIVNRNGVIQIYTDGAILPTPFLDVSDHVDDSGGEAGMLGLAFHPSYGENGKFYVYYMNDDADLVDRIAEFQVTADPNVADPASERILLDVADPAGNHNGGMMEFGSDGYLYISDGDGGQQGDPNGNAQNKNRLLGKIMRIDVDTMEGGRPYGIPDDNPYADGVDGAPEVYVYGMRNPWRWSFDRGTGDMYVGDVGQETIEEVTVIPVGSIAGADLGWNDCEGLLEYPVVDDPEPNPACETPSGNRIAPVAAHDRRSEADGGQSSPFNSIIGGQVYRGSCFPDLVGRYFYSDYGASQLWTFVWSGGTVVEAPNPITPDDFPSNPASIHADALGELYLTTTGGGIYHIVAQ